MNYHIRKIYSQFWRRLKKQRGVVGFDGLFRPKITDGHVHRDWQSFRIYVDTKLPMAYLRRRDVVPKVLTLSNGKYNPPTKIETDIISIGKPVIPPLLGMGRTTKDEWRPLEAGISSMHYQGSACTLNAFFMHKTLNEVLQASNYHCYGMEGNAKVGDGVMNPSPYDSGQFPKHKTGEYVFGVPITFDSYTCPFRNFVTRKLAFWTWLKPVAGENDVDISFASVDVDWKNKIARETTGFLGYADPKEGDPVAKCGRTTDRTAGVWDSTTVNINVQYGRGIGFMTDVAMASIECAGGDSGSPMYYPKPKYIYNAALFAGSNQAKSFGCKISNILLRAPVKLILVKK